MIWNHRRIPRLLLGRWFLAATVVGLLIAYSGVAAAADLPPGGTFSDDDGTLHEPYIEALVAAGITHGCGPGAYCPGRSMTRAELSAFVLRAIGADTESQVYVGYFTDVGADDWYAASVEMAFGLGIMTGYGDSTFRPDEPVTRAAFAGVLLRALGEQIISEPRESYFSDVAATVWYRSQVDRLYELGITQGCSSEPLLYCPVEPITRAELASLVGRAFGLTPIVPPGGTATTTTTTRPSTTTTCPPDVPP